MSALTIPQFCLGLSFTADTDITFNYTVGPPAGPFTLSSNGITRYNCRKLDTAVDLLSWFRVEVDLADPDAGATWTHGEPATELLGRSVLTNTGRTDGKVVDNIVLSGSAGRITGLDLGWGTDTIYLTGSPPSSTSQFMRKRLWIPHNVLTAPNVLKAIDEEDFDETVVVTRTPTGVSTIDSHGSIVERTIQLDWIEAASIKEFRATEADFIAKIGATLNDPHCAWDSFRRQWKDLSGDLAKCRYFPDYTDTSTYVELLPREPWIGNTKANTWVLSQSPAMYRLRINATRI